MTKTTGYIFLGPPGSGKGTQAQVLAAKLHIPHISTGEMLREAIAQKTELGQKAQAYMSKGELVPDELLLGVLEARLTEEDAQKGWILDGFPRTVNQAQFLDQWLLATQKFAAEVINLDVPKAALIQRLLSRGRQDDTEDTIRRRLEVYQDQTAPVIDYYQQQGALHPVNGDQSLEAVTQSLMALIGIS